MSVSLGHRLAITERRAGRLRWVALTLQSDEAEGTLPCARGCCHARVHTDRNPQLGAQQSDGNETTTVACGHRAVECRATRRDARIDDAVPSKNRCRNDVSNAHRALARGPSSVSCGRCRP